MTTELILKGPNICLMGPSGTGKTFSLGTLVDSDMEVFYLGLEPGLESLVGYYNDTGKPIPDNLHWHQLEAPKASFTEMLDFAGKINTLSLDALTKLSDPNRMKHNQFIKLLEVLNNFTDQRTGEVFGSVANWTPERVLVIDGLTGLCRAVMSMVIGGKPVRSQADWQIAQDQVERLLRMLCDQCACSFVLIAHVEREVDQVLGGQKLMVSALGKALTPKIPAMFSDVILTVRNGSKWTWDTASALADTKTRNLSISSDIPPDFRAIITKWRNRNKA